MSYIKAAQRPDGKLFAVIGKICRIPEAPCGRQAGMNSGGSGLKPRCSRYKAAITKRPWRSAGSALIVLANQRDAWGFGERPVGSPERSLTPIGALWTHDHGRMAC